MKLEKESLHYISARKNVGQNPQIKLHDYPEFCGWEYTLIGYTCVQAITIVVTFSICLQMNVFFSLKPQHRVFDKA